MRGFRPSRRWALILPTLAATLFLSCGKTKPAIPSGTGGNTVATGTGGVTGSANAGVLKPCLDQPSDLPRPPTGNLPCDLIPPGLTP
jgi:hypothetical protein